MFLARRMNDVGWRRGAGRDSLGHAYLFDILQSETRFFFHETEAANRTLESLARAFLFTHCRLSFLEYSRFPPSCL